jgi:HK97 family phage prohead protease
MLRKRASIVAKDSSLGPRQIRIVASDGTPDRVGDVMVAAGCDYSAYRSNPIVLAQHDPDAPIGVARVQINGGQLEALIDFAPAGVSAKADEYCGLAKAGIINAASVGFEPIEREPIKSGGWRYVKWSLLEISLVSVPANPNAVTIARSHPAARKHDLSDQRRAQVAAKSLSFHIQDFPEAWRLWLARKFPALKSFSDRQAAYSELMASITRADRRKIRLDQFGFMQRRFDVKERVRRVDDAQGSRYRNDAPIAPSTPPAEPFSMGIPWNPSLDPATNAAILREWQMRSWR